MQRRIDLNLVPDSGVLSQSKRSFAWRMRMWKTSMRWTAEGLLDKRRVADLFALLSADIVA
jgi:hypothetical protein